MLAGVPESFQGGERTQSFFEKRMIHLHEGFPLLEVGILEERLVAERRRCGDSRSLKVVHQLVVVLVAAPLADDPVQLVLMVPARLGFGESLVLCQLRLSHGAAQCPPLSIIRHGDADPVVIPAAAIAVVGSHPVVAVAPSHLHPLVHQVIHQRIAVEHHAGFLGSQIDVLTFTGPLMAEQGRQNREGGRRRASEIDGAREDARWPVRIAGDVGKARCAGEIRRVAHVLPVRTRLAARRRGQVDDVGLHLAQGLVIQAKSSHHTRPHVLDHHVALLDQLLGDLHRPGLGEVETGALLVEIQAVEDR